MIVRKEEITIAKDAIKQLIITQVEYGDQTKVVQSVRSTCFAMGQFLGNQSRTQRGIHASSTCLRVLVDASRPDIVQGLIQYLQHRKSIEQKVPPGADKAVKLERDEKNTIKICEILYALSFVPIGQADTEDYKKNLKNKLNSGLKQNGGSSGWGYFLDEGDSVIQVLPTAYAVLALARSGYHNIKAINFLKGYLKDVSITGPTGLSEVVFTLFSLLAGLNNYPACKKEYDAVLNKIWHSEYCTMTDNYEQNLEYWFNTIHEYIRVPWQLYLLAIISKVSTWKFYSVKSQGLLTIIVKLATAGDFKYPYSGPNISSRTNAILYETLSIIEENLHNNFWYNILYKVRVAADQVRKFVGSSFVRYGLGSVALVISGISVYKWTKDTTTSIGDLGPEFMGWVVSGLLVLLFIGKKK